MHHICWRSCIIYIFTYFHDHVMTHYHDINYSITEQINIRLWLDKCYIICGIRILVNLHHLFIYNFKHILGIRIE